MSEFDPENFEQGLRRLKPAKAPEPFLARLAQALPGRAEPETLPLPAGHRSAGWLWLRWLAPAGIGAAALVFLFWRAAVHPSAPGAVHLTPASVPDTALRADQVEVDQQLIAVFDTIENLPDGRPVRFRCREWSDNVVVRDSARGVVIENRTPRLEVVPVRFEAF